MANVENLETHVAELQAKVDELKSEMSAAISEIVSIKSQSIVKAILAQFNLTGNEAKLTWEFYPESDDEGGTDWYPENLTLYIDGEKVDMEEHTAFRKSSWSNNVYEDTLYEAIREDFLDRNMTDMLHADSVEGLLINIGEEN